MKIITSLTCKYSKNEKIKRKMLKLCEVAIINLDNTDIPIELIKSSNLSKFSS